MKKGKCFSAVNRGQRKKSDFYQTPYSMTKQLMERVNFQNDVFEPAYGEGAIVNIVKPYNYCSYDTTENYNFLNETLKPANIITNPPFSLAYEFIEKAKELVHFKTAMLLPLQYLHGQKRYDGKIFKELKEIFVFTRYPLLTDKIRKDGKYNTGMIAYAWYIWEKGHTEKPVINWVDNQKYVLKKGVK